MQQEIILLPALNDPNLKLTLEGLLDNCQLFRGCTAFWTIDIDFFSSKKLAEALKKDNSFLCADMQLPTSITNIQKYYEYGATEIYLHQYKLKDGYLLHSKILVFDSKNGTDAEIWIGSHNLTTFAITGLNLEASVSIKCKKTDKIYIDTCAYLEEIKNDFCLKFDPQLVNIYLKLQNEEDKNVGDITQTIEIVGEDMNNLQNEQIIQLLSGSSREFSKYRMIGTEIYLHAYDIKTKLQHLYKCKIEQAGKLGKDNKLELNFVEKRRFAKIQTGNGMPYPLLYPQIQITNEILDKSQYFVNISIAYKVHNYLVCYKPSDGELSFWQASTTNPYYTRQNTRSNYKILKATFDETIEKKFVDLPEIWHKLGESNNSQYQRHLQEYKEYNTNKNKEKQATDMYLSFDYKYWYGNEKLKLNQSEDKNPLPSLKPRIIIIIDDKSNNNQ